MKAGWEYKKFREVCELKKGKKPQLYSEFAAHLKPYLVAKYLRGGIATEFASVNDKNSIKVTTQDVIIICDGSNSGETFIGFDGVLSSTMAKVVHGSCIQTRFLILYLESLFEKFNESKTGSAIPHLDLAGLREELIPIPPTVEQARIVAILDAAFAEIATAKANAEKNLQNARALFESYLNKVFTDRDEGWVEYSLEDAVTDECTLSYGIVQPGNDYPLGLPVVRPTDLVSKVIELEGLKRIDPKLADGYKRTRLKGGELLLCVRGSTGVVSIASPDLLGGNVTRGIVPIVFDATKLSQEFGYFLMLSGFVQSQIREKTYGTALMQINIGDLRRIAVVCPQKPIQRVLVDKLETMFVETRRLESIYQQKLAALDELKKSLLHQAFSGNL